MLPVRTLLIGRRASAATRDVSELIASAARSSSLRFATTCEDSIESALHRFSAAVQFDSVILIPEYRHQYSDAKIRELQRRFGAQQVWMLVGSWLEGETRSGKPSTICRRIYRHQLAAKLRQHVFWESSQFVALAGCSGLEESPEVDLGDDTCRPLPNDRVRSDTRRQLGPAPHPVLIVSELPAQRDYLSQIFAAAETPAFAVGPSMRFAAAQVSSIVVDATADVTASCCVIGKLRARYPDAPIVALSSFPREDEVQRYTKAGAQAVVGKPFVVGDLVSHLTRETAAANIRVA